MECCAKIYVRVYRSWGNARVLAEFPRRETIHRKGRTKEYNREGCIWENDQRPGKRKLNW